MRKTELNKASTKRLKIKYINGATYRVAQKVSHYQMIKKSY